VASAVTFLTGLPPAPAGVVVGGLYLLLAWVLRAVPAEVLEAFRGRGSAG
jgi:hypothetical protein